MKELYEGLGGARRGASFIMGRIRYLDIVSTTANQAVASLR